MSRKRGRRNNDDDTNSPSSSSVGYYCRRVNLQILHCSSRRFTRQQARAAAAPPPMEICAHASSSTDALNCVVPFSLQEGFGEKEVGKPELLVAQSANPDGKAKGYESNNKLSTSGASLQLCQTEIGNVECNQERTEALNYKYIGMRGCSYLTEMVKILGDDSGVEEISSNVSDQVTVQGGYEVKKEYVPTVSAILEKQGNIAKNCFLHTVEVRSFFLEQIAIIVEKLDKKFVQIKESEVTKLLGDVKDIDSVNIEIEWLHDRLKKIQEVKKLLSMKTEKDRNDETMKEVKQVLQQLHQRSTLLTERRKAAEARSEKIKETVKNSEADLNFFMKYSLRHGLL